MKLCSPIQICLAIWLSSTGWTQDWPAFRGPGGDGIAAAAVDLPTQWSSEDNIAWRTELPGQGWSSPVTRKGRIYLTAAIPDSTAEPVKEKKSPEKGSGKSPLIPHTLSLLVLDAATGELLQNVSVMKQKTEPKIRIHAKNSHASPTPIVDGQRIFVHFGYQGTACLTLDGKTLWSNRELFFRPTHGNGGSPILVRNRLIFTCDGDKEPKVVALDADTGKVAWQTLRPVSAKKTFSFCTPSVFQIGGTPQVVAPGSDCVLALNPETGETIWQVLYEGYSVVPKPVYGTGLVFLSTSFDSPEILAIRPDGHGDVTDSHVEWKVSKNAPKTPSMIAQDGLLYSISDDGIAICVEAESGENLYRKRIGGGYSASPVLAGDRIYLFSESGETIVIAKGPEFRELARNDLGERTLATPAVLDQSLILRTENALYRIEK